MTALGQSPTIRVKVGWLFSNDHTTAAIGLSEETDAITVVVSEETGAISIAQKGKLYRRLEPENFDQLLRLMLANKRVDDAVRSTTFGLATTAAPVEKV